jgi:hypothetical protein
VTIKKIKFSHKFKKRNGNESNNSGIELHAQLKEKLLIPVGIVILSIGTLITLMMKKGRNKEEEPKW